MKINPCAKINLGLNIVRKRPDGYHDLQTVFYPVPIYDELEIVPSEKMELTVVGADLKCDMEKNLVVKAYRQLEADYKMPPVSITLTKRIPSQAGMGGGSSDCAYTIRLLNQLFNLGMDTEEMRRRAAKLGADCAFFITDEPLYAEGIGEIFSPVNINLDKYRIEVALEPGTAVSTAEAFRGITPKMPPVNCKEVVEKYPVEEWKNFLTNDFEESVFSHFPQLREAKQKFYDQGAVLAMMTGSGSAIFGIFPKAPLAS